MVHVHDYGRRILRGSNRGTDLFREKRILANGKLVVTMRSKKFREVSWIAKSHQGISHIYLILYCIFAEENEWML